MKQKKEEEERKREKEKEERNHTREKKIDNVVNLIGEAFQTDAADSEKSKANATVLRRLTSYAGGVAGLGDGGPGVGTSSSGGGAADVRRGGGENFESSDAFMQVQREVGQLKARIECVEDAQKGLAEQVSQQGSENKKGFDDLKALIMSSRAGATLDGSAVPPGATPRRPEEIDEATGASKRSL